MKATTDTTPVILSISPALAGPGDTVTVFGRNLPTNASDERITINQKPVNIFLATPDSLQIKIPPGLGSGTITLAIGATTYSGPSFTYNTQVIVTTVAGTGTAGTGDGPGGQASFYCPWGIVADLNGDLYIADTYNRLIRKISAADSTVSTIPIPVMIGSSTFYSPYNIALDLKTHDLYLTDFNTHVMQVTPDGSYSVIYTGIMPNTGIGIGPDGDLYVSNNTLGLIKRMDESGQDTTVFASGITTPRNIIFDPAGNLYVPAYFSESVIYQITQAGQVSIIAKDPDFQGWEIARDTAGNFYEADHFANVIRKIESKTGNISIIAGSGSAADVDGIGLQASFNGPQGLTIDSQGNLYVTTYNYNTNGGNKVRKITFQ